MEEEILKMIKSGIHGRCYANELTAHEINSHIMKFIEWIQDDCEFWYEMNRHVWQDVKSEKEYNLNELYQHWSNNVKNGK